MNNILTSTSILILQTEKQGKMNIYYTNDGLHFLEKGYLKWTEVVKSYVDEE